MIDFPCACSRTVLNKLLRMFRLYYRASLKTYFFKFNNFIENDWDALGGISEGFTDFRGAFILSGFLMVPFC